MMKMPVPLLVKATVPVGGVGDEAVSVTVTEQLVCVPTSTVEGEQETVVLVGFKNATVWLMWLGCEFLIAPPKESRADPVAPPLSTTLRVAVYVPPIP